MRNGLLVLILLLGLTASIPGQTPSENPKQARVDVEEFQRRIHELKDSSLRSSQSTMDEDVIRRLEKGIFAVRIPLPKLGSVPERFPPADLNMLLAEDYIRIGAGGEIITRPQEIEKPQLSVYPGLVGASVEELRIRLYGEAAVATSLLTIKENRSGVEEIRKYRVTNVYVKRGDQWRLVSSQFTTGQG